MDVNDTVYLTKFTLPATVLRNKAWSLPLRIPWPLIQIILIVQFMQWLLRTVRQKETESLLALVTKKGFVNE